MAKKTSTKQSGNEDSVADAQGEGAAPFEAVLEHLEGIVGRLEGGELSLEDSLKAYEEGVGLVREAQGRLDGMESKLEELRADGTTVPLADEAGA